VAQPAAPEAVPGEAETALAVQLRARREALEARERLLVTREAVLAATEQRLSSRVDELASLQTRLERSESAVAEREENHWRGLAKLYETMRPREAAAVFNELELPILVQIVDRMNDRRAAPVLGAMQPDRVRQLTAELARHRAQRPQSPTQQEGSRQ
jgi:flagellar motility protein MotE (MotC chaperone)